MLIIPYYPILGLSKFKCFLFFISYIFFYFKYSYI